MSVATSSGVSAFSLASTSASGVASPAARKSAQLSAPGPSAAPIISTMVFSSGSEACCARSFASCARSCTIATFASQWPTMYAHCSAVLVV